MVAYNKTDLYLTKEPQITFFKMSYKRHTNFSTEIIPQPFDSEPDFGKNVSLTIGKNGDLIRNITLVFELPKIPKFKNNDNTDNEITKFAWVEKIGYAIIKKIEIEIGGEIIDRHFNHWLNIWNELTKKEEKNTDRMIGNIPKLKEFTNGKQSYKLYVPLQFWFNRVTGLALPIISLEYNEVRLNLELNDLDKCYKIAPTHFININDNLVNFKKFEYIRQNKNNCIGRFVDFDIQDRRLYYIRLSDSVFSGLKETDNNKIQTNEQQKQLLFETKGKDTAFEPLEFVNKNLFINGIESNFQAMPRINASERVYSDNSVNFNNIKLKNAFALIEYIYLDNNERLRFYNNSHEYLIEQLLFNGEQIINGISQNPKINMINCCKELFWITQLSTTNNSRVNDLFNYTNSLIKKPCGDITGENIIKEQTILIKGNPRLSFRDSFYFNHIQPYYYHTRNPCKQINSFSFCFHPELHQPSGSINFSKFDDISLKLSIDSTIDFNNTAIIRIYALTNNILRVTNGISGVVFANDVTVN